MREKRPVQTAVSEDMFRQKKPCVDCPFLKRGGIRHGVDRVSQYASYFLNDPPTTFPCHATRFTGQDNSSFQPWRQGQTLCAGGLIFAEKIGKRNLLLQLAERFGWYTPSKMEDQDKVCDSLEELVNVQRDGS